MEEKNKNLIFYISAELIILAGIFFRILFYSYARPFWNDESAIALNLINHRYIELFGKMDYYQAAPPLFCIACKFFLIFIKKAEYALRALPLVFSCLSLPVFFMLAKKVLKSKTAIIFALILFALNYQLIYFSQELKPYSGEVFWFLSILLLYFYIDFEKRTKQNLAAAAVFLAVSVWFSYTAVFALAVLFLTMFANNSKKQTILLFIPSVASSLLLLPRIRELSSDSFLYNFWAAGFIKRTADPHTVVIPILNIYGTGGKLQEMLPDLTVTDGCIYIASQIKEPGKILMSGKIFRVVYGLRKGTPKETVEKVMPVLKTIEADPKEARILPVLSSNIERDALEKFSFVSPMAAVGACWQVSARAMQPGGEKRETFIELIREIQRIASAMGVALPEDMVDINLKIMDDLAPTATASMQRDIAAGKQSEVDGLIYQVVRLGEEYQVEVPVYKEIGEKLRERLGN